MDVRLRCLRVLAAVRQEQSSRDNPTPHIDARHEEPLAPYFTSESESTRLLLKRSIKVKCTGSTVRQEELAHRRWASAK